MTRKLVACAKRRKDERRHLGAASVKDMQIRTIAPHTHPCPDCGLLFDCQEPDSKCESSLKKRLRKYGCRGGKQKKVETEFSGTCVHCGETDLQSSDMASLRWGEPSLMCKNCHEQVLASTAAYNADMVQRARTLSGAEAREASRREAWAKMSKKEQKNATAGKATLELFVMDETDKGVM